MLGALFVVLMVPSVLALSNTMSVQGKLVDLSDVPQVGARNFQFRLYTVATGGTSLYEENMTLNLSTAGLWSHVLGTNGTLAFSTNATLWLELVVDGETLAPRLRLSSSPYTLGSTFNSSVANGGHAFVFDTRNVMTSGSLLQLRENGSVRVYVDHDGQLGVNTSTPNATLNVVGTANVTSSLWVGAGLTVGSGSVTFPSATIAQAALAGLSLPYSNLTGTLGGLTLANISNYHFNVLVNQSNITSGLTIPYVNLTGTISGLTLGNISNYHYNVLVNQTNISSGLTVPAANISAGSFPTGAFDFTALNINGSVFGANVSNVSMVGNTTYFIPAGGNQVCFERFVGVSFNFTKCVNATGQITERIGVFAIA